MTRGYRFAARPKWLAGHLLVLAAVVAMVLLGRWQFDVSNSKHFNIQNFGYALQWWIFSLAAIWGYSKILRDNAGVPEATQAEPAPQAPEPVAYRRYVPPQAVDRDGASDDDVLTNYNAYLASLEVDDQKAQPGRDGR